MTERETEPVVLHGEEICKRIEALAKELDAEVTSGPDARGVHDFLQDRLFPVMRSLADDARAGQELLSEHDELLDDMSSWMEEYGEKLEELSGDGEESRLTAEDAQKFRLFVEGALKAIEICARGAKDAQVSTEGYEELLKLGKQTLIAIDDITISGEEEEEEEEDGDEDENKK